MNDARRKELEKARVLIAEARDIIDAAATDEREYHDNMPENMKDGEKAIQADNTADMLEEISRNIEGMLGEIEDCES